jgi:hypothetical protein
VYAVRCDYGELGQAVVFYTNDHAEAMRVARLYERNDPRGPECEAIKSGPMGAGNEQTEVTVGDVLKFETKEAAQVEIDKIRGWDARPVRMTCPDPDDPTKPRDMWVIEVRGGTSDPMYMREDGFVR